MKAKPREKDGYQGKCIHNNDNDDGKLKKKPPLEPRRLNVWKMKEKLGKNSWKMKLSSKSFPT